MINIFRILVHIHNISTIIINIYEKLTKLELKKYIIKLYGIWSM